MSNVTVARWEHHLRFRARTGTAAEMELDGAGEQDTAKPLELVLTALCGCTGMDVISICRKKRQDVTAYSVGATGEQRDEHPRTYASIVVEHHVRGNALDDAAIARAIELSASRYCPVSAHLSSGDTRISHRYVIEDESGTREAEVLVTGPFGAGLEKGSGPTAIQSPAATPGSERSAGPM